MIVTNWVSVTGTPQLKQGSTKYTSTLPNTPYERQHIHISGVGTTLSACGASFSIPYGAWWGCDSGSSVCRSERGGSPL